MIRYSDPLIDSMSELSAAEILDGLAEAQLRVRSATAAAVDEFRYERRLLARGQRAPHRLYALQDIVGRPWNYHDPFYKGAIPVSVDNVEHRVFLSRDAELDSRYLRALFHFRRHREFSPEDRLAVGAAILDEAVEDVTESDGVSARLLYAEFVGIAAAEAAVGFQILDRRLFAVRAAFQGTDRATEIELDPTLDRTRLPSLMEHLRGPVQ